MNFLIPDTCHVIEHDDYNIKIHFIQFDLVYENIGYL